MREHEYQIEKISKMRGFYSRGGYRRSRYLAFVVIALLTLAIPVDSHHAVAASNDRSSNSNADFFAPFNKITEEMVLRQPDWNPSLPLPKTIEELSKIVVDVYTPSPNQPKTGWVLNSITFFHVPKTMWRGLQNMKDEALTDKWYCRIYISASGDYKDEWWKNQAEANLFLDGTVIQPPTAVK